MAYFVTEVVRNKAPYMFLNYFTIEADKVVKDTKCHQCLKTFGY